MRAHSVRVGNERAIPVMTLTLGRACLSICVITDPAIRQHHHLYSSAGTSSPHSSHIVQQLMHSLRAFRSLRNSLKLQFSPTARLQRPAFSITTAAMAQEFKLKDVTSLSLKNGEKQEVEVEGVEGGEMIHVRTACEIYTDFVSTTFRKSLVIEGAGQSSCYVGQLHALWCAAGKRRAYARRTIDVSVARWYVHGHFPSKLSGLTCTSLLQRLDRRRRRCTSPRPHLQIRGLRARRRGVRQD